MSFTLNNGHPFQLNQLQPLLCNSLRGSTDHDDNDETTPSCSIIHLLFNSNQQPADLLHLRWSTWMTARVVWWENFDDHLTLFLLTGIEESQPRNRLRRWTVLRRRGCAFSLILQIQRACLRDVPPANGCVPRQTHDWIRMWLWWGERLIVKRLSHYCEWPSNNNQPRPLNQDKRPTFAAIDSVPHSHGTARLPYRGKWRESLAWDSRQEWMVKTSWSVPQDSFACN